MARWWFASLVRLGRETALTSRHHLLLPPANVLHSLLRIALCCAPVFICLQQALADPALWKALSPSATVYLFGTVHVLPGNDGGSWLTQGVRKALADSSEVWTEADVGDLAGNVDAIRHYGLDVEHTVTDQLPPSYRKRFDRQMARTAVPAALVAHARPWLAEILLNQTALQQAGPMGPGVEASLLSYAHAHHLTTPTFETVDQQFAMMADIPVADQLASLKQQIDEFSDAARMFAELLAAWRGGDEAKLDSLTNQDMRAHDEALWTELILRRNERFAQRIGDRLQGSGTAFVAVGAAHLCGSTGVPALLGRAGFTVTRVQ